MQGEEYEKILGALLGCAVGDAMGMPAEMWSRHRIQKTFGEIRDFLPGPPDNEISAGFEAGEATDDSIVTVLVAQAMVRSGGIPAPLDLVRSIEDWALAHPKSRTIIGPSTQRAFGEIARGVPPQQAGRYGETNGASMRISPVGAVCCIQALPLLVERVHRLCLPTHNTGAAIAGACAVAAAVAHGVDGGPVEEAVPWILKAARMGEERGYESCGPSVTQRIRFSLELSASLPEDQAFMQRQYELVGCGLPTAESVATALAVAVRCGTDVLRCARLCANLGGDTDTMGAIACAVSGAHAGARAIPPAMTKRVCEVNGFDFPPLARELCALREKLKAEKM